MITHYDLFAGIGGFSLALEEVFSDETIRHIFCEWESFPTSVLRQHWPDGEFWGDIKDLVAVTKLRARNAGTITNTDSWPSRPRVSAEPVSKERLERSTDNTGLRDGFTIVTGGFPCQPFSAAGRRKGTADDRYQWPNMYEVIRNTKPEWVIAENVRGLVTWNNGLVLEQVCADLESQGYEVQPFIIPAIAVGAPHRRDRVWIIAHNPSKRLEGSQRQSIQRGGSGRTQQNHEYPDWNRSWQEVAFATCDDSVDDGLSRLVDGVPYSAAKWRRDSLKAYGNGIVPEVAINIMQAIKSSMVEYQE